jgi:hypothetical protein
LPSPAAKPGRKETKMKLGNGTLDNISRTEFDMLTALLKPIGVIVRVTVSHGNDTYNVQFINAFRECSIFDTSGLVTKQAKETIERYYPG